MEKSTKRELATCALYSDLICDKHVISPNKSIDKGWTKRKVDRRNCKCLSRESGAQGVRDKEWGGGQGQRVWEMQATRLDKHTKSMGLNKKKGKNFSSQSPLPLSWFFLKRANGFWREAAFWIELSNLFFTQHQISLLIHNTTYGG